MEQDQKVTSLNDHKEDLQAYLTKLGKIVYHHLQKPEQLRQLYRVIDLDYDTLPGFDPDDVQGKCLELPKACHGRHKLDLLIEACRNMKQIPDWDDRSFWARYLIVSSLPEQEKQKRFYVNTFKLAETSELRRADYVILDLDNLHPDWVSYVTGRPRGSSIFFFSFSDVPVKPAQMDGGFIRDLLEKGIFGGHPIYHSGVQEYAKWFNDKEADLERQRELAEKESQLAAQTGSMGVRAVGR